MRVVRSGGAERFVPSSRPRRSRGPRTDAAPRRAARVVTPGGEQVSTEDARVVGALVVVAVVLAVLSGTWLVEVLFPGPSAPGA